MIRLLVLIGVATGVSIGGLVIAGSGSAEGKRFTLEADAALVESGAVKFVLPRFSLKTSVRIELVATGGDAVLAPDADGAAMFQEVGGDIYRLEIRDGPNRDFVERFRDWLRSDVGLRAVEGFKGAEGMRLARVGGAAVEEVVEVAEGDADLGSQLALQHCGRCHVVDKRNRFGGIGSTPSFGAMKNLPRWRERFEVFWTLNPHPAFTQIDEMTEPFDPTRPSPIAPLELTLEDVEAIVAFVVGMPVKDLGGALVRQ